MKKKVLLNAFQFDPDGVSESYLAAKWKQVLSDYVDVDLVTGERISEPGIYNPSFKYEFKNRFLARVNSAVKFDYFTFNKRSTRKLKEVVKNYDIFHHVSPVAPRYPVSLGEHANRFILGPVAGGLRVPTAFRKDVEGSEELFLKARNVDSLRFKYDKKLIRTYDAADTILIAGSYLKDILPSKYQSKFKQFLDVGVDVSLFDFQQRFFNQSTLNLVYVGRVVPYKGLMYLLKALSLMPQDVLTHLSLTVAGDMGETDYEKQCYTFVKNNGLSKCVKFRGYVSKVEVNEIYNDAHIFCFPSLAEAGGTVVVEALSKGLPVIAARLGGPAESVTTDCGSLVETIDPDSFVEGLKDAILSYLENPDFISASSLAARVRAESHYDWSRRAEKMFDIYSS